MATVADVGGGVGGNGLGGQHPHRGARHPNRPRRLQDVCWATDGRTTVDTAFGALALGGVHFAASPSGPAPPVGQMTNPPMTKDAIAGRIRRLLALADDTARRTGIPDTTTALTPTMREDL